jgi:XRE family transcriptional regulator, regulator of sulfur utilization
MNVVTPQMVGGQVRRFREAHHVSVRSLAERTGFSASFISQVENGQASPSISSLHKIADALGVTLSEFFAPTGGDADLIVRHSQRPHLESSWSSAHIEALGRRGAGRRLEPFLVTLEPGGRSGKHPHSHRGEQFAFILAGTATLALAGQEHVLRRGDAVTLRPGDPRLWENRASSPTSILVVISHPPD